MRIRLWPKGLVGQLVVAIAVTLFVGQAVNFTLLLNSQRQQAVAHGGGMIVARIVDGIERERRGDIGEGTQIISLDPDWHGSGSRATIRQLRPSGGRPAGGSLEPDEGGFRLRVSDMPFEKVDDAKNMPDMANYARDRLAEAGVKVDMITAWSLPLQRPANATDYRPRQLLYVTAKVGPRYYTARGRLPASGERLQGFLMWQTVTLYLLLLVPIMLIAWRAAKPLRALTQAARANPMLRDVEPIEEKGPTDVRELIHAFNSYRERIGTMLSDKDRMLGAVGHDLRTPLASLRVRVEQVDNDMLREKMIASIEEMTAMLVDILALARSGAGTETVELVDGPALLKELAADYSEQGKDVRTAQLAAIPVKARPLLLRRALRNLIGNAAAYGERARLSLSQQDGMAAFCVADDGPGLSEEQIRILVEPFARGEQSRNRATGGAGLGLSIARDIAEGEGGRLLLRTRAEGGLDALILLPILR